MLSFRILYSFSVIVLIFEFPPPRFPIPHEDGLNIKRFSDVIRDEIMVHTKELTGAKALINGKLVRPRKFANLHSEYG